jgi:hypothetical protein
MTDALDTAAMRHDYQKMCIVNHVRGDGIPCDEHDHCYKCESPAPCPMNRALDDIDRLSAELVTAERALLRHGYRKSCDIPACNCGDQWNHGGHAAKRLAEIDGVLEYANGKTILQRVEILRAQLTAARAELAECDRHAREEIDQLIAERRSKLKAAWTAGWDSRQAHIGAVTPTEMGGWRKLFERLRDADLAAITEREGDERG